MSWQPAGRQTLANEGRGSGPASPQLKSHLQPFLAPSPWMSHFSSLSRSSLELGSGEDQVLTWHLALRWVLLVPGRCPRLGLVPQSLGLALP